MEEDERIRNDIVDNLLENCFLTIAANCHMHRIAAAIKLLNVSNWCKLVICTLIHLFIINQKNSGKSVKKRIVRTRRFLFFVLKNWHQYCFINN